MESYLDNRTREAKQSASAEAFSLPELNPSEEQSSNEGNQAAPEAGNIQDTPRFDPNAVQEVPIALEDVPEGKRPKVQLVMEDDKVSRVIVTCSCGECVELECNY